MSACQTALQARKRRKKASKSRIYDSAVQLCLLVCCGDGNVEENGGKGTGDGEKTNSLSTGHESGGEVYGWKEMKPWEHHASHTGLVLFKAMHSPYYIYMCTYTLVYYSSILLLSSIHCNITCSPSTIHLTFLCSGSCSTVWRACAQTVPLQPTGRPR